MSLRPFAQTVTILRLHEIKTQLYQFRWSFRRRFEEDNVNTVGTIESP